MEEQSTKTIEELREAWRSHSCEACEAPKSKVQAFCTSCTLALQIWVRNWLAEGPESPRFAGTYWSALCHLKAHRDRIKRLDSDRYGWTFASMKELEAAGYTPLNVGRCSAIGCSQEIGWLESPTGKRVPVNLDNFQPHRTSCKNPGVYRKKRVQSSARRVRGRGAR